MNDAAARELLACYEAALRAAARSLGIARALAEGHRAGVRPPDDVIEAYLARVERDEAQVKSMRAKLPQFKSPPST